MSLYAPRDVKSSIYDLIKAMVYLDNLFRYTNLVALILFLQDVGPHLDGAVGLNRSGRLTDLLTVLSKNPAERTRQQYQDVKACIRNHGRLVETPTAYNHQSVQHDV